MKASKLTWLLGVLYVAGCGGTSDTSTPPAPARFNIGGTVTGLTGTGLVLSTPGEPDLAVAAGSNRFTFANPVASGTTYSVSVKVQPSAPEQSCTVTGGSGSVGSGDVTTVAVTCSAPRYPLRGTVSGLTTSGLVLMTPGLPSLAIPAGATAFVFSVGLGAGSAYEVAVQSQPAGQVCEVTSAVGTMGNSGASVVVNCRAPMSWASDCGDLAEHEIPVHWRSYAYQPAGYHFTSSVQAVADSGGPFGRYVVRALTNSAFDFALVFESPTPIDTTSFAELRMHVRASNTNPFAWQGTFPVVVLRDTRGVQLAYAPAYNYLPSDGRYWVPVVVPLGGGAGWTLGAGPSESEPGQVFDGLVDRSSIVAIEIHANSWDWNSYVLDVDGLTFARSQDACSPNPSTLTTVGPFLVGGSVTGLEGSGLRLAMTGEPPISLTRGAGSFTFGAPVLTGTRYEVSVETQPEGQTCSVANGAGRVGAADVSSMSVSCVAGGTASADIKVPSGRQTVLSATGGVVLITGGVDAAGAAVATAAVYEPTYGTVATVAPMNAPRVGHSVTPLPGGGALVAGGDPRAATAEIWNPDSATFRLVSGGMRVSRSLHTETLLPTGKVLISGGTGTAGVQRSAEIFDPATGTFTATGSMSAARYGHTATLLPNGKVLVAGGSSAPGDASPLASSEIYDPATGTFTVASAVLSSPRTRHRATLLPDGRVLLTGGGQTAVASADLFDPVSSTIAPSRASMNQARKLHSATLLPNGRVLLAGGENASGTLDTTEIFDPVTGNFTLSGKLTAAQSGQSAVLLPNGEVLMGGGTAADGSAAPPQTYAPLGNANPGQFTSTAGTLNQARWGHTATLLGTGKILIVGGVDAGGAMLRTAELYDPVADTFTATGSMSELRVGHTATRLPDGQVLVASSAGTGGWTGEIYDPRSGSFGPTGSTGPWRSGHTGTLLSDGTVLFTGGIGGYATAEIYDPAIGGTRAVAAAMSSGRFAHSATLLMDGRVLLVGGYPYVSEGTVPGQPTAEIYDPLLATFTPVGSMRWGRASHTAVLLPDGRVLVTGGSAEANSEEIFDPRTGVFVPTGSLVWAGESSQAAALLPDGSVLVVGRDTSPAASAAIASTYAPGSRTLTGTRLPPVVPRSNHTVTILPNGKALVVGGTSPSGTEATAEIYSP